MINRGMPLFPALAVMVIAVAACGGGSTSEQTNTSPTVAKINVPTRSGSPKAGTNFTSPSGNVSCFIDAAFVRCDIAERNWSPPPRPSDCELDYGQGITLSRGESAGFVCAGDTTFGGGEPLAYGDSIGFGPMRCESAESGITCRDIETGKGFSISREAYQLF